MNKLKSVCVLAILVMITSILAWSSPVPTVPHTSFTPCQIGMPGTALHMQAQCTSLSVPENYAQPDSKHIRLHIAVLKARSGQPAPDPLFFIAGGPGEASTQAYVQEAAAFERMRANRDIVLVDQRGTGESNPLNCPPGSNTVTTPTLAEIMQQTQSCLKQLPDDPRFYTTTVAVQDLDAVRTALGYAEINLYGVSYGTRVALEYLRAYPEQVRSVILDGVVPPDWNVGESSSQDAQRTLNLIFKRCAADHACHQAYPDLAASFAQLKQQLKQHAVSVSLRDPLTGAPLTETLNWDTAAGAVQLLSYLSETAALLPLLIHQASVAHDFVPLLANAYYISGQVSGAVAMGMHAAVLCTEDLPFYPQAAALQKAAADTYLGGAPLKILMESCAHWPRGVMEPDFKKPVDSDKPVLLLSGEDDPITPPANAAHVAQTLANSLSIVVTGQGHGNAWRGCVPELMAKFIEQASVKKLDTACVKNIQPFPFFTSFTGPGP